MPAAGAFGPMTGVNPTQFKGQVIDDTGATKDGPWSSGTNLKDYVGWSYLYAAPDSGATAQFQFNVPADGQYEVRIAYRHHENRGNQVPVDIEFGLGSMQSKVNMTKPAADNGFQTVLSTECKKGESVSVKFGTEGAGGFVCIDAVQLVRIDQ